MSDPQSQEFADFVQALARMADLDVPPQYLRALADNFALISAEAATLMDFEADGCEPAPVFRP